jgi:Ca2+/H+ antiporter
MDGQEGSWADDAEEEEFNELTDGQLKIRALGLLLIGTLVVTIFADPMVDTINAFAKSINVKPFFISCVVTPIASNASEIIAGFLFA